MRPSDQAHHHFVMRIAIYQVIGSNARAKVPIWAERVAHHQVMMRVKRAA